MKIRNIRNRLAEWIRAQEAIDEVSLAHQFFGSDTKGHVMIDVGAHTGESFGPYAEDGWQVFAFEPDPRNNAEIRAKWGNAGNVVIDTRAVADTDDPNASLQLSSNTYLSSLSAFDPSHTQAVVVGQTTLASSCAQAGIQRVDFLKIDAEGHDLRVLKGFPWQSLKPRMVVCEFEDNKTRKLGYGMEELADLLVANGYHVIVSEWYPIVSYEGPFRWKRFFSYPQSRPDEQGNGNLVAVKDRADFERLKRLFSRKRVARDLAVRFRALFKMIRG